MMHSSVENVIVATNPYKQRVDAIKQLLNLFKPERTVYLVITLSSLLVLLTCAIVLICKSAVGTAELVLLFSSSGGITYSTGRLLRMWSEAIRILQPNMAEGRGTDAA